MRFHLEPSIILPSLSRLQNFMSELHAASLITDLEIRQDEALQALAELEKRIELALSEFGGTQTKGRKQATATVEDQSKQQELRLHDTDETSQPSAA